jgi:uncharacterized membrane protein YfcA
MEILLIASCFSIGFFFESIFGFGGGVIAYSILSFFIDIKTLIVAGFYIGTMSSLLIIITSYQHFEKKIFIPLIINSTIASLFGVFAFVFLPLKILSMIFGLLLIIISLKNLFFDKNTAISNDEIKSKKFNFIKQKLIFIGGLSQGAFGTGGPFVVNALKNSFSNKSSLRATMAGYFLFCNIVRAPVLIGSDQFNWQIFKQIFWIIIPVFIAIKIGHKVHLSISANHFRIGIGIISLIAGFKFLFI